MNCASESIQCLMDRSSQLSTLAECLLLSENRKQEGYWVILSPHLYNELAVHLVPTIAIWFYFCKMVLIFLI